MLIESAPCRGTTVTLFLPCAAADAGREAATPGTEAHAAKRRVMVVDDEMTVRETLAFALEDAGHLVLTAESGAEALALLEAGEELDILITDLSMPGLSGIALVEAAQALRPKLPAILLTGYADTEIMERARGGENAGPGTGFSVLLKPTGSERLLEEIAALTGTPKLAA